LSCSEINSGKSQFNISFGYQISFEIPFDALKEMDREENDIKGLTELISNIYNELKDNLLSFTSV
jgi:dsDNA-specific endonuclease/ATPase MutS2